MVIACESYFKDSNIYRELLHKGWVVVPNALATQEVDELCKAYAQTIDNDSGEFYLSVKQSNSAKSDFAAYDTVKRLLSALSAQWISHMKCVFSTFVVKPATAHSKMGLHQDWSIVDESRFFALNVWVPLQDVDQHNGALSAVPGSHIKFQNRRGQGIADIFENSYHAEIKTLEVIAMKRGDLLIKNPRLLHASAPNMSSTVRVSAMITLVPEQAKVRHYYQHPNHVKGKVEVFECPDDFYQYFDLNSKPIPPCRSLGFIEI